MKNTPFLYINCIIPVLFIFSCTQTIQQNNTALLTLSNQVDTSKVVASFNQSSPGGNTSVANDLDYNFKWSGHSSHNATGFGYFTPEGQEIAYVKRNRDIGQTFTITDKNPQNLAYITLRLGFGDNVVRPDMYGQYISLQLFEVRRERVLNNNGSDTTMNAFHGYPHNRYQQIIPHDRDDFFEGIKFEPIAVVRGFKFPEKEAFGFEKDENIDPDHANLKGRYLNFNLPEKHQIQLEPGKAYAFLVMIDSLGVDRGFTLGNLMHGHYPGGHGIRREGHGIFPPLTAHPGYGFDHPVNEEAVRTSLFPADFSDRIKISPGTNGYPDVDTWRDLEFYIKAK